MAGKTIYQAFRARLPVMLLLVVLLPLALASTSFASERGTLQLHTFESPPYQLTELGKSPGGAPGGTTVKTVNCILKRLDWGANITVVPQNRAIYSLGNGSIEGYFAVSPSMDLDSMALRSVPIALEKWYFFSLKPDQNPRTARIGAVGGSNEEAWLTDNGYATYITTTSIPQLFALMERDRIDIALMDYRVMANYHTTLRQFNRQRLYSQFVRYAPLFLYLRSDFAEQHPDFLTTFNLAMPLCQNDNFFLTPEETDLLLEVVQSFYGELIREVDLPAAIAAGPAFESIAEILHADEAWLASDVPGDHPLARHILELPASGQLRAWRQRQGDQVTEVFVTNAMGAITAMSDITSDFWQGDEAKFQRAIGLDSGRWHITPIRYDASTNRFQVMASTPLWDQGNNELLGTLVLGLDVERLLKGSTANELASD